MKNRNTVKKYADYLENSFLLFTTNRFSYSLKQQFVSNKKVYCIDNGMVRSIAFRFSENKGKFLENLAFLELRRKYPDIYYYKTSNNLEVDFLVREGRKNRALIQVTQGLGNEKTRQREIAALVQGMSELKIKKALILTEDSEERIKEKNKLITVKPIYKWIVEDMS